MSTPLHGVGEPFDLAGPLPTGTTVLEASAGTGKTYTIAELTARYVGEGVPLERILLVTFGRLAAGELRARVRERLVSAAASELDAARRERLMSASASFDTATIATTHTFAAEMLRGLGMAADVDPDVSFLDDPGDLVRQVVSDLYLQAFATGSTPTGQPPFSFSVAKQIALAAAEPSARLAPDNAAPGSEAARRVGLANVVRREVRRRKQSLHVQDFDDLLVRLRDALADPVGGSAARQRLRDRFDIVMVDEFQDTDPVQWDLLKSAFHGHRTLVLIGDPKQAIYAFRGGDVYTYLAATEAATARHTLSTSWRSDADLVAALDELIGGVALGDERIRVHPVQAHHAQRRLSGAPEVSPLRLRVVSEQHVRRSSRDGLMPVDQARHYVASDVARDIGQLLDARPEFDGRLLQPGDVAVLVATNGEGGMVRDELAKLGIPVVLVAATSVFTTAAARDWLMLLRAMEQPHRRPLVRAAALTCFVGWTADDLARADENALDEHASLLRAWGEIWHQRGGAALLEELSWAVTARILAQPGGERVLTDVRHVGQILDTAQRADGLGATAVVAWLRDRIAESATDGDEERSRRLDSDADAVQVVTIHRSKGLEFPVVYVPFLWNRFSEPTPELLLFHDDRGMRVRDVGGRDGDHYSANAARHVAEDLDEALRLAYVALTRAESQVVTWWAPSVGTEAAPLHRLAFGERADTGELPRRLAVPADDKAWAQLKERFSDRVCVEEAHLAAPVQWPPSTADATALALRTLTRHIDTSWTRTSYSSLTADLHGSFEPDAGPETGTTDEPESATPLRDAASGGSSGTGSGEAPPSVVEEPAGRLETTSPLLSPMRDLPVGAAFGTLVHSVYEKLDFTSRDLRAALAERCAAEASGVLAGVDPGALADALLPSLQTPLGPLAGDLRLADFAPRDVLAEMEYEYPLAGGDSRPSDGGLTGFATVDQIADLLDDHLPETDPIRPYADDLRVESLRGRPLRGFVGGFLDVVLRVRDEQGTPRYVVVDYKTNWLGAPQSSGVELTSASYTPEAMARAMRESHYPLQALLYSVALHRFLRWRQPGYDPEVHLGGALYLFVRGMCGPDTPAYDGVPAGVFSWDVPAALVVALSELIEGRKT